MKKNIPVKKLLFLFTLIILVNFEIIAQVKKQKDVIFITSQSLSTNQLSKKELKNIFLGKKKSWDKKTKVRIVLNISEEAEEGFLKFIGKSKGKYEKYWDKMIFTGKANPPVKIDNSKELFEYLEKNPGTISYISKSDTLTNKSIKIIDIKSK